MRGYLNYFENECNFIVDTAYIIKDGSSVLICSGNFEGKEAVLTRKNGMCCLEVDGESVSNLQGMMIEVSEENITRKFEEQS